MLMNEMLNQMTYAKEWSGEINVSSVAIEAYNSYAALIIRILYNNNVTPDLKNV